MARKPSIARYIQFQTTASSIISNLLKEGDREDVSTCLYQMWIIWKARNKATFDNQTINTKWILHEASILQEKYEAYNQGSTSSSPSLGRAALNVS